MNRFESLKDLFYKPTFLFPAIVSYCILLFDNSARSNVSLVLNAATLISLLTTFEVWSPPVSWETALVRFCVCVANIVLCACIAYSIGGDIAHFKQEEILAYARFVVSLTGLTFASLLYFFKCLCTARMAEKWSIHGDIAMRLAASNDGYFPHYRLQSLCDRLENWNDLSEEQRRKEIKKELQDIIDKKYNLKK